MNYVGNVTLFGRTFPCTPKKALVVMGAMLLLGLYAAYLVTTVVAHHLGIHGVWAALLLLIVFGSCTTTRDGVEREHALLPPAGRTLLGYALCGLTLATMYQQGDTFAYGFMVVFLVFSLTNRLVTKLRKRVPQSPARPVSPVASSKQLRDVTDVAYKDTSS